MTEFNGNLICGEDFISLKDSCKYEKINGYFKCMDKNLKTLEGSPKIVKGHFIVSYNDITSLKGSPEQVDGDFVLSNNSRLTSLEGCTKKIKGTLMLKEIKRFKDVEELKKQVIKYQIKAKHYSYGKKFDILFFKDIKKEFKEYGENLRLKEIEFLENQNKELKEKRNTKIKEAKNKASDFGLGI